MAAPTHKFDPTPDDVRRVKMALGNISGENVINAPRDVYQVLLIEHEVKVAEAYSKRMYHATVALVAATVALVIVTALLVVLD